MLKKYDYIIAGAGLAGLSLAYKIRKDQSLNDHRILLIDKDRKQSNDRTWCFWSKRQDTFDDIIFTQWPRIKFASHFLCKEMNIEPYVYKMIRGIDFYNHVIPYLKSCPNTDFVHEAIDAITDNGEFIEVKTNNGHYTADYIFKSYYDQVDFSASNFVWQHFKGWVIETDSDCFDPELATFMDFRVEQEGETRFFYVLPHDKRRALIEIAIFSGTIPESQFYDPFLKAYTDKITGQAEYRILEEELGAIPMTDYAFNKNASDRIIHIGTNGGRVKASSGYAFSRIQKETDRLLDYISKGNLNKYIYKRSRYDFYDSIMLNAILSGKTTGEIVFTQLFDKIAPQTIFKFLDEEGSFFTDLKIFTAPPTIPFFKAFVEELTK